jgi:hypothetical protein
MPKQSLTDAEAAAVLNYVYQSMNGKDVTITPEQVKKQRK